jgi:PAS domain S-box-containing protein
MFKSLGFRIWLPFSLVLFSVFAILIIYNSYKQEQIYLSNRKTEVNKLAKTLVQQIKIGIEEEDFESIKKSLEIAKSSYGFEMVKFSLGEISINYPENTDEFKFKKDEIIDEDYKFNTVLGKAELCFITSTKQINDVISKNNQSTTVIFLIVFLLSNSIFLGFTLKISKPFKDLVALANKIESQDYQDNNIVLPNTNEIQVLHKSLISLMDSLKSREEFKDNLLRELESQVKAQTQELNQLSLVAKYTTNGVVITDSDRRIIWVNKSFEQLTGYSLEEVKGQTPKLFQFEKTEKETIARINKLLTEHKIVNEEVLNRSKDGREYWLSLNIVPILNKDNQVDGYIAVEIDITEKKNREVMVQKMNETLEQKVLENTKKNIELSKSLIEQDKLATIGEISAGIAHDLNTPLGTIRVGADNVRYMIDHIMSKELNHLSSDELKYILENAPTRNVENFIGGLQLRKEKALFIDFLKSHYENLDEQIIINIAELAVRARISLNDDEILSRIFSSSNPLLFTDVFYQIYQACNQLETIKSSSDKAVKVVQDVRSFIKGENSFNERRSFNLKENISTVLGVFRYELEHGVDLRFEIDPSIEMVGFDVKLFQLWSNLLKNAIEAMDEQDQKYIGIFSKIEENKLQISFENNGPQIPDDIQKNMFNKFYTTKEKKSGSGMGLSIVQNILTDHNASIEVHSDKEITRFTVTFDLK